MREIYFRSKPVDALMWNILGREFNSPRLHHQTIRQSPDESRKSSYERLSGFLFANYVQLGIGKTARFWYHFPEEGTIYYKKVPLKVPSCGGLKMAPKSQSLELTIRNARGVKGEIQITRCGAGLEMWVSVNQSGKTLKKWVLRYIGAAFEHEFDGRAMWARGKA